MMTLPKWLEWAREIQALAQTGSHYAENEYQFQRNQRLIEIAAEIVSEYSTMNYSSVLAEFMSSRGYATPKVDVRGAVFQNKKLLLVRESTDGGWTLPGGWADVGETPSQATEREVWEEAGLKVVANKIIGIYDANRVGELNLFHAYKIIFLCDLIGGSPKPSNETTEVCFFERDDIPHILSGERTTSRHILDAFAIIDDPFRPSLFD